MGLKKILDFPFSPGKQWKDAYSARELIGPWRGQAAYDFSENFTVLGQEDVEVPAGKFKAFKLEYKTVVSSPAAWMPKDQEFKHYYWYSPEVKYLVKCQYDKTLVEANKEVFNWELTSFQLKK